MKKILLLIIGAIELTQAMEQVRDSDSLSVMLGKLFVISAPSGAGKTTLVEAVLQKNNALKRVLTYTSRLPRVGEVHGKDYNFTSVPEFEAKINAGFFLEWSNVYGAYYGSPQAILEEMKLGSSFIIIVDREGAKAIKSKVESAILIWITPPSLKVLEQRLLSRGTDCQKRIEYRLDLAKQELELEQKEQLFKYNIVNDTFVEALGSLDAILLQEIRN